MLTSNASQPFDCDIALIFTAFQRNCIYASIIKELGRKYRIALFLAERDEKTMTRIGNTNRQFLDLCVSLGAEIVVDRPITSTIAILAQSNYSKESIELIENMVQSRKTFWMSGVAMGNAFYANLHGKTIDKILVPDRRVYDYRIAEYDDDGVEFPEAMIEEVGIPYSRYPLFEETVDVDYILANPTPFSFVTAQDRLDYLENVLGMVEEIADRGEVVAFKPHNADERADYIVDGPLLSAISCPPFKWMNGLIDAAARRFSRVLPRGGARDLCVRLSLAVTYRKLMRLVTPLSELTQYHNLNLEIFMPAVRRGLITGRSNSIWHALFLKKPVWNCVDREKPYFSETKMHKYMMTYLDVHGNYHDFEFDEAHYDVIRDSTRLADLIQFLDSQVNEVSQMQDASGV